MTLIAVLGSSVVAHVTDPYPWGGSDSVAYIVSARNLLRGDGLGMWMASGRFSPLTHFPPLYPLLLAAGGASGVDLLVAARWIDILLFGLVVLTACYIAWEATRSGPVAIALGLLIISSPRLLQSFSSAMSEPPFILLSLLSLLLAVAATRKDSLGLLVGSAVAASLATLTRYAGIGLIPAGAITVFALGSGPVRSRLARAGLYLLVGLIPLGGWAIAQRTMQGGELPRSFSLDLKNLWDRHGDFRGDLATWGWYLVPGGESLIGASWRVRLIVFGGVVALPLTLAGFVALKAPSWRNDPRLAPTIRLTSAISISIACFLGGLSAAFLWASPRPDIDERMLLPLQILIWLLLLAAFLLAGQYLGIGRSVAAGSLLAVGALLAFQVPRARSMVTENLVNNHRILDRGWRDSEMMAYLQELPQLTQIVTNESATVLLWADRAAYDLPELLPEAAPRSVFRRYGDEPGDPLEAQFREGDFVLALFDSIHGQLIAIYGEDAEERYEAMIQRLEIVADLGDGTIYRYPP